MPETVLEPFIAFLDEHRHDGEMNAGLADGYIWLVCYKCGARITRPVERLQQRPA
jgi:hypothetical protein